MRKAYVLYISLWLFLSLIGGAFFAALELKDAIDRELKNLHSLSVELRNKEKYVSTIKSFSERWNISPLTEKEALEVVVSFMRNLKKDFQIDIRKDFYEEAGLLKVRLSLKAHPESSYELVSLLGNLSRSVKPIVSIREMRLRSSEAGTVLELDVELIQPFKEEHSHEIKA